MESLSLNSLLANEILVGMVGMSLALSVLYTFRQVPTLLFRWFTFIFTSHVTITNSGPSYWWIQRWFFTTGYMKRNRRLKIAGNLGDEDWLFVPGEGNHLFWRGFRPFIYRHMIDKNSSRGVELTESVVIMTLGRNRKPLTDIIDEASAMSVSSPNMTSVFTWNKHHYWHQLKDKQNRSMETVFLNSDTKFSVTRDLSQFYSRRDWYSERGIPYRRAYLFSGSPGTGKTSFILALAGELQCPVYFINLSTIESDDVLIGAFVTAPAKSILVIEDIDAMLINGHRDSKKISQNKSRKGVTLSGFLNVLDGILSPDGRVVFMTTNYPERLDKALLRAGRTDVHVRFEALDRESVYTMFKAFYGVYPKSLPEDFREVGSELQKVFMEYDRPELAEEALKDSYRTSRLGLPSN